MAIEAPQTRSIMLAGLAAPIIISIVLALLLPELRNTILGFIFTYGIAMVMIAYFDYIPGPNHRMAEMLRNDPAYVSHLNRERASAATMPGGTLEVMALGVSAFLAGILIAFL